MDGAGLGLSSAVVRYFYLKQVTSYATASSMVLILHEFCKSNALCALIIRLIINWCHRSDNIEPGGEPSKIWFTSQASGQTLTKLIRFL